MPTGDGKPTTKKLVLWNDVIHSMYQATKILINILKCDYPDACRMAYEVHSQGRAVVFTGTPEQCDKVRQRFLCERFNSSIE